MQGHHAQADCLSVLPVRETCSSRCGPTRSRPSSVLTSAAGFVDNRLRSGRDAVPTAIARRRGCGAFGDCGGACYHRVFRAHVRSCCTRFPRVPIVQRPRTWPFQGQNTGSNPVGDASLRSRSQAKAAPPERNARRRAIPVTTESFGWASQQQSCFASDRGRRLGAIAESPALVRRVCRRICKRATRSSTSPPIQATAIRAALLHRDPSCLGRTVSFTCFVAASTGHVTTRA